MRVIAAAEYVDLYISKLSEEIEKKLFKDESCAFVGIYTNGDTLCRRIVRKSAKKYDTGALDINFYRDDFTMNTKNPIIRETHINFVVEGRTIVLVDDVVYTGRTIRAALDALFDFGRPARVILVTLVDRSGRELPIQPDVRGMKLKVNRDEEVVVQLKPHNDEDRIFIRRVERVSKNA